MPASGRSECATAVDLPLRASIVSRQRMPLGSPRANDPGRDDPVPKVMGIVNLTPDSFSDGGRLPSRRSGRLRAIGWPPRGPTCSTWAANRAARGPSRSRSSEELRRVIPVVEALADRARDPDLDRHDQGRSRPRAPWPPGPRSSTTSPRSPPIPRWPRRRRDPGPASSSCTCKARPRPCRSTRTTTTS